jgi:hypothetical protein
MSKENVSRDEEIFFTKYFLFLLLQCGIDFSRNPEFEVRFDYGLLFFMVKEFWSYSTRIFL